MTIGERIKSAREAMGITQVELGEKVGVSGVAIMRYEKNQRRPSYTILHRLADALGVSALEFFLGNETIEVNGHTLRPVILLPDSTDTPKLHPSEFNEFERFIETIGYYTRLDGDNYRLHKGTSSVVITPEQLKGLVRASKATVGALVQDLMEATASQTTLGTDTTPPADVPEMPTGQK